MSFTPQLLGQAENTLRALLNRFLEGTGLTYHTWVLLNATAMDGGQTDRAKLGGIAVNALKIEWEAVDAGIGALANAGLVTATPSVVRLTDAGSAMHQRLRAEIGPATAELIQDLPADDLAAAGRVLTTIIDRANAILATR